MELWWAIIVPVLLAIAALVYFRKQVALWEPLIPTAVTILLIVFFRYVGVESLTKDTEYWGNCVTEVRWYQEWDEWIEQTCYRSCNCTTDKDGHESCDQCPYDCSYREDHPEHWTMILNDGSEKEITQSYYTVLKAQFGGKAAFVDMHRDFYRIDGDMYSTAYPNTYAAFEFYASEHPYKNKVQASTSIFNYPEVTDLDKTKYKLYDYPEVKFNGLDAILAPKELKVSVAEQKKFDYINGMLGMSKQVRVWVCLWKDALETSAEKQEAYWKRGNKNEIVVCASVDKGMKVQWCRVFGWAKSSLINIETRDHVTDMDTLNLSKFGEWMYKEVQDKWVRTTFEDFDYLAIDPPRWAYITTWIASILSCIGLYIWIVTNRFTATDENGDGTDEFDDDINIDIHGRGRGRIVIILAKLGLNKKRKRHEK